MIVGSESLRISALMSQIELPVPYCVLLMSSDFVYEF